MSPDPHGPERHDGVGPPASVDGRAGADRDPPGLDRLPPPAFPPGSRRVPLRRAKPTPGRETGQEGGEGVPPDAFISPDEPLSPRDGFPDDAFIRPDDPIVRRPALEGDAFISPDDPLPPRSPDAPGGGVVTDMGDDPHLQDRASAADGAIDDPQVAELARRVGSLADALRDRGEAGLRVTPGMSRFEATLRAYCVGWLTARREGADSG